MSINLTQEENWAADILNSQVTDTQTGLRRTVAARDAFVRLIEIKYNASFDSATGKFTPKKKEDKAKKKPASST